MTRRGAVLSFLQTDMLPPVIPVEVDEITTHHAVGVDPFLAKLMGTQPGISCEVQLVDILACFFFCLFFFVCFFTLTLNHHRPNQWQFL